MRISVVIATYNGETFIREQLDSILSQTVQDFEVVVCDDCSSDGTWNILQEYAERDSRFTLIQNEERLGCIKNYEKAITISRGEYVALCDQDDIWTNDHLEVLLDNIGTKMLSSADFVIIDEAGKQLGCYRHFSGIEPFPEKEMVRAWIIVVSSNLVQGASMLIKREFFTIALPVPDGVKFHDAWFFFLSNFYGGMSYTQHIIAYHRKHSNNVSQVIPSVDIYGMVLLKLLKDCSWDRLEMLMAVQDRVNGLNVKKKMFIHFCVGIIHRNKRIRGRLLNFIISVLSFRHIYHKSPRPVIKQAFELAKRYFTNKVNSNRHAYY